MRKIASDGLWSVARYHTDFAPHAKAATMNDTMKALVYQGPGKLAIEERPMPVPGPDDVLIEVKSVSICGSDLGAYRHASDRFAPPLVLGHEFAGVVKDFGEKVAAFRRGQKVSANPMLYCGVCYYCRRGDYNLCGNRKSLGTAIGGTQTDGAMREYMTMRSSNILPLRDGLSFSDGAMLEPLGVCLACAKRGRREDEENVVVLGMGPIGLMTVKFLKAMGVRNVIVTDVMSTRLSMALQCGADHAINVSETDATAAVRELTGGVGADRVIIAAGIAPSIAQSLAMVRNGGTVVLVALMHDMVEFDPMQIVARGISFLGSYMFTTEMAEAMDMLADGRVEVRNLITSTLPLAQGKEAFDALLVPGNREIKVQLTMND